MQANSKNLYRHVDFLTSIYPYRNYKNTASLNKAAAYIHQDFLRSNLSTSEQQWTVNTKTYRNVIAHYQPEKNERFIIGAHYDVYKEQPGADDNASSVSGLLEIARLFSSYRPKLNYGVDFVAYSLEEPPFFKTKNMGSYIHAQSMVKNQLNIIGMLALEMIGYYKEKEVASLEPPNQKPLSPNLLIVSGIKKFDPFNKHISRLLQEPNSLRSRRLSYADHYKNNGPSDHRNYWPLNIPAAMVIGTGGKGNPHYHKITDTIDRLDFKVMTEAVNSIAFALINF